MAVFYLDQDVGLETADYLRSLGHFVETTHARGRFGTPDGDQLLVAAQNGWILVSHNERDFVMLHDAWLRWGNASSWTLSLVDILVVPRQF